MGHILDPGIQMTNSEGKMVGRSCRTPIFHEFGDTASATAARIGIAGLGNLPLYGFTLGCNHFESPVRRLRYA
jgi:hypothetical protein